MPDPTRVPLVFGGLMNSIAENLVPQDRCWRMSNCNVDRGILEVRPGYALFGARTSPNSGDIAWGFGYGKFTGSSQNKLQIAYTTPPTGGSFTLKWRPSSSTAYQTTAAIAWNATAVDVQKALLLLSNVKSGDITVIGGPLPYTQMQVDWSGQYANLAVDPLVVNSTSLTGGSGVSVVVTPAITGGRQEAYLVALQKFGDTTATLYKVDPDTGVYTSVATGLHASDWYFTSYSRTIFAANDMDGIHTFTLGGAWDNGAASSRPLAPGAAPTFVEGVTNPPFAPITGSCTFNNLQNWGTSAPTFAMAAAPNTFDLIITTNSAVVAQAVSFDCIFPSPVNLQYHDFFRALFTSGNGIAVDPTTINVQLLNATPTIIVTPRNVAPVTLLGGSGASGGTSGANFQMCDGPLDAAPNGPSREFRKAVPGVRITFKFTGGQDHAPKTLSLALLFYDNWLCDTRSVSITGGPIVSNIDYVYSYYRVSDNSESQLSPVATATRVPINFLGSFTQVSCLGSTFLSGSDLILVYRREVATGLYRLIPNADGSIGSANDATGGVVVFNDHLMEHELASLDTFGDVAFPGVNTGQSPRVLGNWKQSLVVGFQRQAWFSFQGRPGTFVASPDEVTATPASENDSTRGVTEYVSDNRSEEVLGIVGQDSCYVVTELSCYSKVGDAPGTASFMRRLPGSRGAMGTRAFVGLGGGVDVASQDGLWFYSVSRFYNNDDQGGLNQHEETLDVRTSYRDIISVGGTAVAVAEFLDELWVFSGPNYIVRTRNGKWNSGAFADSFKAIITNRIRGFKLLDSKGRIMSLDRAYTTDNGTAILWDYETGWLESGRVHLKKLAIQGSGTPSVEVSTYDGKNPVSSPLNFTRPASTINVPSFSVPPGFRYKLRFHGGASDTVESAAVYTEVAPGGRQN